MISKFVYPLPIGPMKKILLLFFIAIIGVKTLSAQTYVYDEQHTYFSNIRYTVLEGHILPGSSIFWSDAILTTKNDRIFKGFSTSTFDVLYTIDDNKVHIGDSNFSMDVVYSIKNGKVYKGDSTMMLDCLFTYDPQSEAIYKGDSKFPLDAVIFLQGKPITDAELIALLIVLEMI
jgi:hypothetical protein